MVVSPHPVSLTLARPLPTAWAEVKSWLGWLVILAVLVVGWAPGVWAAPVAAEVRAEAAARFDRALRLFDQGDNAGALAEFKRAYDLVPNRLVLTNIGLVYAALGRPVEATDTLDRALGAHEPGTVPPELLARARKVRKEQAERVGLVAVTTNVPANIDMGGVDVGRTPLAPVRVPSGTVVVGAAAPGRLPSRREVTVAGGTTVAVAFELQPAESALAHLTLRSGLPGAAVLVDGAPAGQTPLAAPLALAPGDHVVELRRPGYFTATARIHLPEGARSELVLEPSEDGGRSRFALTVSASEPGAQLAIDGRPRGLLAPSLIVTLPAGPHVIEVLRPGFLPFSRTLELTTASNLHALLVPTPETRLALSDQATNTRRWATAALIAGGALTLGGGALALWAQASLPDARDRLHAEEKAQSFEEGSGVCDPATGPPEPLRPMCEARLRDARAGVSTRTAARPAGVVLAGVGIAAVATGVVLWLRGDDPHRYDSVAVDNGSRSTGPRVHASLAIFGGQTAFVLRGDF
jgi:hypothetical protein